ncbi:MAG TPA: protein kinase [Candidatus Acidoferrum sp.]|nr:protein kinase [Candidatus Acidoferrum sp.]
MDIERWQRIEELYHAALLVDAARRTTFLQKSCAGDQELRREVESLLSQEERIGEFLEQPAVLFWNRASEDARVKPGITPDDTLGILGRTISHYRILEKLGVGGMGIVYKAEDIRLGRAVALKFLPDAVSKNPRALANFRREAQAASALNHPNICTIYDIGEEEGRTFITMEYMEGQTLKYLIGGGPMALDRLLKTAIEISDGLAAAHAKGIIHRDIKPANIFMAERGQAKILDFGLAKFANQSGSEADLETATQLGPVKANREPGLTVPTQTRPGAVMGTLPYMSPEQLRAQQVDHRSDLFSLGVVLYEMATGERPFRGETTAQLSFSILHREPKPVTAVRPELPSSMERILERCLSKQADKRYSSMHELRGELEKVRQKISSISGRESADAIAKEASIAVLPFANLSADQENEFFADGITEEIINTLGRVEELHIAARTSAFSFKGKHVDLRVIGERLHVATVLEGSIRRSGSQIRIACQLVKASDGFQLWSERYDREMKDIFEVQEDIARSIAEKLKISLAGIKDGSLVKAGTENLEAYQQYLKGRALLYRRGGGLPRALECFHLAVALDPQYAEAWAHVAEAYVMLAFYGFTKPDVVLSKAKEAAVRAVSLDPSVANAHNAFAAAILLNDFDWSKAEIEFTRALELNPRNVLARSRYALWCLEVGGGRFEESIFQSKQALEADPLSDYAATILAFAYYIAGRLTEAVQTAKHAVHLEPESFLASVSLTFALYAQGHYEEAVGVIEKGLASSGRHPMFLAGLAATLASWGKGEAAKSVHGELLARSAREYISPFLLAVSASANRQPDEAIQFVQQAYEIRDPQLVVFGKHWIGTKMLLEDPRFAELLARIGLQ